MIYVLSTHLSACLRLPQTFGLTSRYLELDWFLGGFSFYIFVSQFVF